MSRATSPSCTAPCATETELHDSLRAFSHFGPSTMMEMRKVGGITVPVYINEFWTSKQRAGHSLHEISYRAFFKAELPAFFIDRLCHAGDVVYDPFMGRGTTLIEALHRGCIAIGNDINPLSKMLAAPRLVPPTLREIDDRLQQVQLQCDDDIDPDLLVFYSPETLRELYGWRAWFRERLAAGTFDNVDAWLRMVACNRLTGHSKGFFSVYTLPPNQATSVQAQRRINANRNQHPEYRNTKALMLRKSKQLLRDKIPSAAGHACDHIHTSAASDTPGIASGSVKLFVTSPPFLDTVDYVGDNWLRMWFCEVDRARQSVWQIKSIAQWTARMAEVFTELHRVLHPGGWIAFEVGEVRKGNVLFENEVISAAAHTGLTPVCIMIHSQHFTKTANCWGVDNNTKGTNSNRIVILRKKDPSSQPTQQLLAI